MKKKGFTLVELLTVIVMIAFISILLVPKMIERFEMKKDELSNQAKELIYLAASQYMEEFNSEVSCISIEELVNNGFLVEPVIDPKSNTVISSSTNIKVNFYNNQYNYEISDTCFFDVIFNLKNVTKDKEDFDMQEGSIEEVIITPNTYYNLPTKINVSGSDYTWNKDTGKLVLSNAYNNVNVTIEGVAIDTEAPTIVVNPSSGIYESTIDVTISVSDNLGLDPNNVYQYYVSTSDKKRENGEWKSYTSDVSFTITGEEETKYLWVWPIKDIVGNISGNKTNVNTPYVVGIYKFQKGINCTDFEFTYTGDYEIYNVADGKYRVKLLTDGNFTPKSDIEIDAFLVGGGGGGAAGGGGGGGGYTTTNKTTLKANTTYAVKIGSGGAGGIDTDGQKDASDGEATTAFGFTANGGEGGLHQVGYVTTLGGKGGSGGGGFGAGDGGSYGNDGKSAKSGYLGGSGQGTTTCEFGEGTLSGCNSGVTAYAGGGGGGNYGNWGWTGGEGGIGGGGNGHTSGGVDGEDGKANTGGGGGGSVSSNGYETDGGKGGSGIVVIRYIIENACKDESSTTFTYSGEYKKIDDGNGNYRIKFLTSGVLKFNQDTIIDAFLVGGGEGGGCGSVPGGGGGYTVTQKGINLTANTSYPIIIGEGGIGATQATLKAWSSSDGENGETTSAFGYEALGGGTTSQGWGGSGGGGMHNNGLGGTGGSYGNSGENVDTDNNYSASGTGQGTTTCEFGEGTLSGCNSGVTAYAGGGGGGAIVTGSAGNGGFGGGGNRGGNGEANTGGGGGSTYYDGDTWIRPGNGGSGIVIIRNHRV